MRYAIEKPDGSPLKDAEGRQHLFSSLAEARKWIMDGERVRAKARGDGDELQRQSP
jgi:hypothetical protein